MTTVIKLLGAALALFGLISKVQALRSSPKEVFLSGFDYIVLAVGLALIVLGFAFTFFVTSETDESPAHRPSP